MSAPSKMKVILMRALRTGIAIAISGVIAWLAGPEVADLVGTERAVLLAAVLTPMLVATEKWLRYGSDPGEV